MKTSKCSEAQKIAALKQLDAGRKSEEIGRERGGSKHTVYAWKQKYGGMSVSEAQELKQLRDENARLKKLLAALALDKDALQHVIRKKRLQLVSLKAQLQQGRQDVREVRSHLKCSERQACKLMIVAQSSLRYQSRRAEQDAELGERLRQLALENSRYGSPRLCVVFAPREVGQSQES